MRTRAVESRRSISQKPRTRSASVATAKEHLSSLLRCVEREHAEIVLERRGVPIAKIVPIASHVKTSGFGWMRDSAVEIGDIVGPTGEEWDVASF